MHSETTLSQFHYRETLNIIVLGANIFKMTNVPSSRYQKSDKTIGFCDIDLVGKSYWMSKKSSFFTIFSMTKIEN